MHRKARCIFALIAALMTGIIMRLFYIIREQPAQVASSQNSWTVTVAQTRGTIYDTNLYPLVNEKKAYFAALTPKESLLAQVMPATTDAQFSALRDQLSSGIPAAVRLTKPIGFADGMRLFWTPVRYTDRLLAPHTIGYLDAGGTNGVTGIEFAYNDLLNEYKGTATASFSIDGRGNFLAGVQPAATDTTDRSVGGVVLSLDKQMQELAEDIGCQHLSKGAIVIMRPSDGHILAMASFPSFQPTTVADSIEKNDGALLNRALSQYDCGSVFKIITTAAALELGLSDNQVYECSGYLDVEGTRFHCHNRLGHGKLDMHQAFAQSCNLYYIKLALEIGAEKVHSMACEFGLNESMTLADTITASAALLPNVHTLSSSSAALANFSFGQGYLMVSPLHFARITATIANNGNMSDPRLVKGTVNENFRFYAAEQGSSREVISTKTAELLQEMMIETVAYGTGTAAAPNECTAAGKTGTAETGQVVDGESVTQSWFVGYFPAEEPQYAVCVLAENAASTNTKSTVIFRELADAIMNLSDI